jgi:hypothetical protein
MLNDMTGNLDRQGKWKPHRSELQNRASSVALSAGGAISTGGGRGSAFISPGTKKLAGETLRVAETPPQPPTVNASAGMMTSRKNFELNLTVLIV